MIDNVLQNAINQLEAEKSAAYQNAKAEKLAQLQQELNDFVIERNQRVDDAIRELKEKLTKAIDEKNREIDLKAETYANVEVQKYDVKITALKKMLEG